VLQSMIEVSAGLASMVGDAERAARLAGSAEAQGTRTGLRRDPADEAFLAPLLAAARRALGDAAYAAALAAGRAQAPAETMSEIRAWLEASARIREPIRGGP